MDPAISSAGAESISLQPRIDAQISSRNPPLRDYNSNEFLAIPMQPDGPRRPSRLETDLQRTTSRPPFTFKRAATAMFKPPKKVAPAPSLFGGLKGLFCGSYALLNMLVLFVPVAVRMIHHPLYPLSESDAGFSSLFTTFTMTHS